MGAAFDKSMHDLSIDIAGVDPAATKQDYANIIARAPKTTPDVTDAALHVAAETQARSLMTQKGRRSTFLGGMTLEPSAASAGPGKTLLGG